MLRRERGEGVALTNGEFISLSKHHVSRGEVTMDDMFLLVNVTKSQHQLWRERWPTHTCLLRSQISFQYHPCLIPSLKWKLT